MGRLVLLASGRDDALVVVDWREQSVGLITLAWLALIKVRTYILYAMVGTRGCGMPRWCNSVLRHYWEWAASEESPSLEVRRLLGWGWDLYRSNRYSRGVVSVTPGEMSVTPEPTSAVDGVALGPDGDAQAPTTSPPNTTSKVHARLNTFDMLDP